MIEIKPGMEAVLQSVGQIPGELRLVKERVYSVSIEFTEREVGVLFNRDHDKAAIPTQAGELIKEYFKNFKPISGLAKLGDQVLVATEVNNRYLYLTELEVWEVEMRTYPETEPVYSLFTKSLFREPVRRFPQNQVFTTLDEAADFTTHFFTKE